MASDPINIQIDRDTQLSGVSEKQFSSEKSKSTSKSSYPGNSKALLDLADQRSNASKTKALNKRSKQESTALT